MDVSYAALPLSGRPGLMFLVWVCYEQRDNSNILRDVGNLYRWSVGSGRVTGPKMHMRLTVKLRGGRERSVAFHFT